MDNLLYILAFAMGAVCAVLVIGVQERKKKNDPVGFAEWIDTEFYSKTIDEKWIKLNPHSFKIESGRYTTTELFNLYKKSK